MWKDIHKFESRKEIAGGIKRRFPKRENKEWERGKIAFILLKRWKEEKGGMRDGDEAHASREKGAETMPVKPDKRRARLMVRGERDETQRTRWKGGYCGGSRRSSFMKREALSKTRSPDRTGISGGISG